MSKTKLISPGIPNYTLKRNLKLNDKYLSNDGDDEGIRIDNSGNVGLGTNDPGAKLHIYGDGNLNGLFQGSSTVNYVQFQDSNTGLSSNTSNGTTVGTNTGVFHINNREDKNIQFSTKDSTRLIIDNAGDVIFYRRIKGKPDFTLTGSIDPAASTTVTGSGTAFTTELTVGDDIVVSGETRTVTAIGSDTSLTIDSAFTDNANDASPDCKPLTFSLLENGGSEVLVVSNVGDVGVGTANPAGILHLKTTESISAHCNLVLDTENASRNANIQFYNAGSSEALFRWDGNENKFEWFVGSDQWMTLDSSGNLGIGTSSPGKKLDVAGDIRAIETSGTASITAEKDGNFSSINADGTSGFLSWGHSSADRVFIFKGNGSEVARFDDSGNLGIGTTSPSSLLEIQGGLTTTGAVLTLSTKEPSIVDDDVLGRINFQAPLDTGADSDLVGASIAAIANATFSDTVNSTDLHFQTAASETATTKMILNSAGNLGIGTSSPRGRFDAMGTHGSQGLYLSEAGTAVYLPTDIAHSSNGAGFDIQMRTYRLGTALGGDVSIYPRHTGNDLILGTEAQNDMIHLDDATGNIGIGATSPSSTLEIQDGLTTTGAVLTLATKEPSVVANDVLGRINFQAPLDTGADSDLVGASIHALATDTFSDTVNATDLIFSTGASEAAAEKVRITSAGYVGIGTAAPASTLHVAGDIRIPDGNRVYYHASSDYNYIDFDSGTLNLGYTADGIRIDLNTSATKTIEMVADSHFQLKGYNNKDVLITPQGTGNVGIGTAAPGQMLEVAGNIKISGTGNTLMTTDSSYFLFGAHAEVQLSHDHNRGLALQSSANDANGTRLTFTRERDSSGTMSGGTTLAGQDNDEISELLFQGYNSAGTPEKIDFAKIVTSIDDASDGSEDGTIELYTMAAGSLTEIARFNATGLGIGTATPMATLDVRSSDTVLAEFHGDTTSYVQFYDSTTGTNDYNDGLTVGTNGGHGYIWNRETKSVYIGTSDTSRFVATSSGNIGIATNAPTVGATIGLNIANPTASASGEGGALRLSSDDGAAMGDGHRLGVIEFAGAEDSSNNLTVGARIEAICDAAWSSTENGTHLDFYTTDANASISKKMTILATGEVGIGTAAPAYALDVTGDIQLSGELRLGNSDNIRFSGQEAMTGNTSSQTMSIAGHGSWSSCTIHTDLNVTGDTTTFSSANSTDPLVVIKNTTNDANGARLQFVKDKGAAGADGDDIGIILFTGDDAAQTQTDFAKIVAEVSESTDTDEAGKLSFFVAESDGTNTALTAGLVLEGEHATDGQVDVTIAAGSASTTTVAGDLTVNGDTASFISTNSFDPQILIHNNRDDQTASSLNFFMDRAGSAGQDDDFLGFIYFKGHNDASQDITYASIISTIADASDGAEGGKLYLQVASHDGGLETGLLLVDGSADGEVDVTIGNGSQSLTTIAGDVSISGNEITVAGALEIDAGGDVNITGQDFSISSGKNFYLDGNTGIGGSADTYIREHSDDAIRWYVGGQLLMNLIESGDNGNLISFDSSIAMQRYEATFSATGVIGSGGTDDTDIDFRFSNKYRLEMTGDITTVNLIMPGNSANCVLVCTTNGDHDVTNWKVYDSTESAATTTDVMWPGGSVPAFTNNGIDIVSFYWDASEKQCYGVASLAFATP